MSNHRLLDEIQKLPIEDQRWILEALNRSVTQHTLSTPQPMSEEQFEQVLLEKGIIAGIPADINEEEDAFEPVVVQGKPLSETIIAERR